MSLSINLSPQSSRRAPRGRAQRRRFAVAVPFFGRRRVAGAATAVGANWHAPRRGPAVAPAWQPVGVRVMAALSSARALSAALLFASLALFAGLVNGPSFYVAHLDITGRHSVPLKDVYAMTGALGLQVFWVDPAGIEAALKASPSIADAHVEVGWPARVQITLVERTPVAIWQQAGVVSWVAADGRLMPARGDLPGALRIVGEGERPLPGDQRAIDGRIVQAALALHALRPNILALNYFVHGGLEYDDGRGWQAFFGTGDQMPQKLAVYERLVDYLLRERALAPEQIEYIVVMDEHHPFYKVRE